MALAPSAPLLVRPVQADHGFVDIPLVQAIHADDFGSDLVDDIADGLSNPLPEVAFLVAVPEFQHFMFRPLMRPTALPPVRQYPKIKVTSASTVGFPREVPIFLWRRR